MLIVKLALRELHGGLHDFRLFLGCIIVGVSVIAAVGLLSERVENGIHRDAKTLLGGDVEITLSNAAITAEQLQFLQQYGVISSTISMRAMATYGSESTLVELKGVDGHYPLMGAVELQSHKPLAEALTPHHIIIGEDLGDRLGVKPGDSILLGDATFIISDILQKEPDHIAGALTLGPRVIVSNNDLEKAGFLQPGNLIRYNYHLLLNDSVQLIAFKDTLARKFPHVPWIVRTYNENNRTVQGLVERLQLFLTLAGLSSLLIGGVGIRGATESYISAKAATIATFKALGAKRNTVFAVYMTVLFCIALLGVIISSVIGMLLCWLLLPYVARFLPIASDSSHDIAPILMAAAFGILTVFTFSVAVLAKGVEVKPTLLFRGLGATESLPLMRSKLVANILIAALLMGLVIITSEDKKIAIGFILAALGCFSIFAFAVRLLAYISSHLQLGQGRLRHAVANLHRPGVSVFSIMLSIGIGLSVLVALLLVEGNVEHDIRESIPLQAPSLFLIDIQPSQKNALADFLASKPYVSQVISQPMVRGRIAKLNGVPVEQAHVSEDAKWAIESDRGFSYGQLPPPDTHLAEGQWWHADYQGKPLVSFDRKLAQGMGLHVGDTVTLNILGTDIDATIASLRDINYLSLHINFALVLSPGPIEKFPSTGIATLRVEGRENESLLVHDITQKFSNISAIRISETLAQLQEIVGHIITAVRITAIFTLISGLIVLSSAIATTLDKRAYDTVIFKVLGAKRRDILTIFFIEWLIIAGLTSLLSCAFGSIGAWLILQRMDWIEFHLLGSVMVQATLLTVAFVTCTGLLFHMRAFSLKANTILRNE